VVIAIAWALPSSSPAGAPPSEQCQPGDGWNAFASDGTSYVAADNFSPTANGAITQLVWWGAYLNGTEGCEPGMTDAFEVTYFANAGGVPGAVIGGPFRQSGGTLAVTASQTTGARLLDDIAEYQHEALHPAVQVAANVCYWVEIRNRRGDGCAWYWAVAAPVDRLAAHDESPGNPYGELDLIGSDLAFCLNVAIGAPVACSVPPAHDECSTPLSVSEGEFEFSTYFATTAQGEGYGSCGYYSLDCCSPAGHAANKDVWFEYVAPCTAALEVDVCDSNYDSKIVLYDLDYPTSPCYAVQVTCNDDGCGHVPAGRSEVCYGNGMAVPCWGVVCREAVRVFRYNCWYSGPWTSECEALAESLCKVPDGVQSSVRAPVEAGWKYIIRVGGYDADHGRDFPDDPACAARVCAEDPACCESLWDYGCDELADQYCAGEAGAGTLRVNLVAPPPFETNLRHIQVFLNNASDPCLSPPCDPPTYADLCDVVHDFDDDGDVDADDLVDHLIPAMTGP
jgi:hypothetical protein